MRVTVLAWSSCFPQLEPIVCGGASAIEEMLTRVKSPIRVLVVWEPMLPTDWSRPGGMVQSRISDPRAVQFWDKNHLVAKELQEQLSASQICCQRDGIIWDVAAVYPKDIQWGSSAPLFFGGAVVDVADSVRQKLSQFEQSPNR